MSEARMKKVLLSKDLRRLFPEKGSFLDRQDLKVFLASTNDEAQRICMREEVDLIVTMIDMSGIPSEDLFEFIRAEPQLKKASIIMVCGDTLAQRERCKRCKANAVITLPVDPAILHMKMQQFLNVAPRMLYRTALAVAIEGKFRDRPVPFQTENISASGMLIRTEEPLGRGSGVFMSFFLPDGTHISGYGEIVRVDHPKAGERYQYGIQFTNMDEGSRTAIDKAVKLKQLVEEKKQKK
jgi:CheY-like chemotaxis protein